MNVQTNDSFNLLINQHHYIYLALYCNRNQPYIHNVMLENMLLAFTVGDKQSIYPFKIGIA